MRLKGRKILKTTYGIAKFAVFTQYNFRAYGHFKKKKNFRAYLLKCSTYVQEL
jgi:uncharacterized protein (UPF0128 family)